MDISVVSFLIAWAASGLLGGLLILLDEWLTMRPGAEFVVTGADLVVGVILAVCGPISLALVIFGLSVGTDKAILRIRKAKK